MAEEGKRVQVIWIYGPAGTGRTWLAKEYAAKANQPFYISGSSRDIFQTYAGEHTLIMDEFRPYTIQYEVVPGTARPNMYSGAENSSLAANEFELYNAMFD